MTAVDEHISPELVLVCPELAERARAQLASRPLDDVRLGDETSTPRVEGLLAELTLAVGELRREQESVLRRLESVSELVNLIHSNWEEVDRRLARLEQEVGRLEAGADPAATRRDRVRPSLREDVPSSRRRWPLLTGTLLFVGSLLAVTIVLELLPSFADAPRLGPLSDGALTSAQEPRSSPAKRDAEQGLAGPTITDARPSGGAQESSEERRSSATTTTAASQDTIPVAPPVRTQPSAASRQEAGKAPGTPSAAAPDTSEFEPSRSFVWAPVKGAAFYSVRFVREGKVVYTARVSAPRVVLPSSFRFTPGTYRWIVRTDTGPPSNTLGEPIVVSTFDVSRR